MTTSRKLSFSAGADDDEKTEVRFDSTYKVLLSKFEAGDLVYGLNAVRDKALTELKKHGFLHCFANALNDRTVTLVLNDADASPLKKHQLAHHEFLTQNVDYLKRDGGKIVPSLAARKGLRTSIAYRRACKLLLVEDNLERTRTVHVMTEDISWKRVCSKTILDSNDEPVLDANGNATPDLSVTSSEMRAAYRYFKTHQKNHPKIIFYDKDGQVLEQAPWEQTQYKHLFEEYEGSRVKKKELEGASTQPWEDNDEPPQTPTAQIRKSGLN